MPAVVLEPFAERHLPLLAPWFDDPDTQRWLGGRGWLPQAAADETMRSAPLEEFRGSLVLRELGRVAVSDGEPVAYIGGDVYDRGHRVVGLDDDGEVLAEAFPGLPRTAAGIAFVVAPRARGRGIGRAALMATMADPALADVEDWLAGVEPDNAPSRRLLAACGFAPTTHEPDAEGMLLYRLRRRTA